MTDDIMHHYIFGVTEEEKEALKDNGYMWDSEWRDKDVGYKLYADWSNAMYFLVKWREERGIF